MNTLLGIGPGNAAGGLGALGTQPATTHTQSGLALEGAVLAPAWDGQLLVGLAVVAGAALIALLFRLYLLHSAARPLDRRRYLALPALLAGGGLAAFTDAQLSSLVAVLFGLVIGYLADRSLIVAAYASVGGLVGVLSLGRTNRVNHILWSGVCVGLANTAVVLVWGILAEPLSRPEVVRMLALAVANGLFSSSLALIFFFVASALLGITTSLQLLDLAQPTHPLLQELLRHAPGTYYHSLMVSNLAEQAAQRIGADVLLTRVGALFHDVGKLMQPEHFAENEPVGVNMHQTLEPRQSARIIVNHVPEGLRLARQYRLPGEVRHFIAEHHGTSLIQYFYHPAPAPAGREQPGPGSGHRPVMAQAGDAPERSNPEWVAALRGPDRDAALGELRAILVRGLRFALAGRVPGDLDAFVEDIAQEALLRILHGLDGFRGESRFTTWAQKIAIHVAPTDLRRRLEQAGISTHDILAAFDED